MEKQLKIMPAISLYQPWATWIIRGWKLIETRTHNRFGCLKGHTVLIHAGLRTDGSDLTTKNPYLSYGDICKDPDEMVNGYIIGSAFVYDFGELTDLDSHSALIDCGSTKRWGLFLKDIQKFEKPIPAKGELGIWYFNMDTLEKVKKPTVKPIELF